MKRKTEIDSAHYENNCLADEFIEAERNGELLRPRGGKNAIEVMREHAQAKKQSETVSLQLPKPLVAAIKRQAKSGSVPFASYVREALEVRVRWGSV
jgi:predicted DNA binding CopG/RHH family protein